MDESEIVVTTRSCTGREKVFAALYEQAFRRVAKFAGKMGGSFQDAKDILHDALIIFYEKSAADRAALTVPDEVYVLGIAKHLWLRKFKQDKGKISFDRMEQDIALPPDYYSTYYNEENNRLLALLQISGRKCLELLRAFYYDKLGLPAIAHTFGYGTVRSATVQKYKCLEKVRDKVKEKSITYEDLVE